MNPNIITYYRDRAKEYEKVYNKPERQSDLLFAEKFLQDTFAVKNVFEVACGTGYWTQKIAATAKTILATDINDTVLEIAKSKNYSPATVNFRATDIFKWASTDKHESLFGGFYLEPYKAAELTLFFKHS